MGCVIAWCKGGDKSPTDLELNTNSPKEYSWDKRDRIDPANYTIDGMNNAVLGRKPGQINGEQFIIQNCNNCSIYLFDHIATITVDDCTDCRFFIGPVKTSIFIRDCKNCAFIVSCQQFRTRDCHKLDVFLACVSKPIIESSSHIIFAPYRYYYAQLESQFSSANHSPFNCIWSDIHDFTPMEDSNYSIMSEHLASQPGNFVPLPKEAVTTAGGDTGEIAQGDSPSESYHNRFNLTDLLTVEVDLSEENSIVLATHGKRRWPFDVERCLLLLFDLGEGSHTVAQRARSIVFTLKSTGEHLQTATVLLNSSESRMDAEDVMHIIGQSEVTNHLKSNISVIALELSGSNVIQNCHEVCAPILQQRRHCLYHSVNHNEALQQIEKLNTYLNMQMNTQ